MAQNDGNRDLVLAPGEHAYVLDTTKGNINTNCGPYKTSMAGTDQPVIWDEKAKKFERVQSIERAIQRDVVAPEGFYIALYNPAADDKSAHPRTGASSNQVDLNVGHRVNIPGPSFFPLWPGQFAEIIRGHHLRSNQYVVAEVYNDVEANKETSWSTAVIKPAKSAEGSTPIPTKFTAGQLLVIQGTDVSFFIPPTGIKIVPEQVNGVSQYIRDAVTLERLEFCILLDENGNKRFVKGPAVVFPKPTETFVMREEDGAKKRKFRALELNETTGIYVKVIADYDEGGVHYTAGDELFITGKEQAIYYQREEHAVIRYGNQTKHYAVAIPAGEGRYVLNRQTGEIALRRGPLMLLCDPRHEVIVMRVLSEKTAALWYPGNAKVVEINKKRGSAIELLEASASAYEAGRATSQSFATSNYMALQDVEDKARTASRQIGGDTVTRGTAFTPPRTITLDTKYDGAVGVSVWSNYAVLVVDKTGNRRVVEGPDTILLEYDETLAPLGLSTGKPKSSDRLLDTVYLRVKNNAVTDVVTVETSDWVPVKLTVNYRVNFEGVDAQRWFAVENYIALLCDQARSRIRNAVKRHGIEAFHGNAIDIVRDTLLGTIPKEPGTGGRPGLVFAENGMRLYDVEVIDMKIEHARVAQELADVQFRSLKSAITIAEEERGLLIAQRSNAVRRTEALDRVTTAEVIAEAENRATAAQLTSTMAMITAAAEEQAGRQANLLKERQAADTIAKAEVATQTMLDDARLAVEKRELDLRIEELKSQTAEFIARAGAMDGKLATALTSMADSALLQDMVKNLGTVSAMQGIPVAEVLAHMVKGTPVAPVLEALAARTQAIPALKQ